MELEEAIEILNNYLCETHRKFCSIGAVGIPNKEYFAIETVLNELKKYREGEIISIKVLEDYYLVSKDKEKQMTLANKELFKEYVPKKIVDKQEKRISDLEFALMDMVLQFADESKDSINTMGLSALETAFSELDFDNPMPIKKVHEQYKKLAKQYFEKKAEEEN